MALLLSPLAFSKMLLAFLFLRKVRIPGANVEVDDFDEIQFLPD